MSEVKKLTPQEREDKTDELRKKHQPLFDAMRVSEAIFIPKMAHYQKGLNGLHMGFFRSELESGEDVYTEMVDREMSPESKDRTLWRWRHNPHFADEYAKSEPMSNGKYRYFVPVDELEKVEQTTKKISTKTIRTTEPKENTNFEVDAPDDAPLNEMTLRDDAAIRLGVPLSHKKWLNKMIEEANNKIPY